MEGAFLSRCSRFKWSWFCVVLLGALSVTSSVWAAACDPVAPAPAVLLTDGTCGYRVEITNGAVAVTVPTPVPVQEVSPVPAPETASSAWAEADRSRIDQIGNNLVHVGGIVAFGLGVGLIFLVPKSRK